MGVLSCGPKVITKLSIKEADMTSEAGVRGQSDAIVRSGPSTEECGQPLRAGQGEGMGHSVEP